MKDRNRLDWVLYTLARHSERCATKANGAGDKDTAIAFDEVGAMLDSLVFRLRSPLLDELQPRLKANGHGLDYENAKRAGKALALVLMERTNATRYAASKVAARESGVSQDILERELPRTHGAKEFLNSPDGQDFATDDEQSFDEAYRELVEQCNAHSDDHVVREDRVLNARHMLAEKPSFEGFWEVLKAAEKAGSAK